MNIIPILEDFLEVAKRNRKYPVNSVYGYKAALKMFDEELNDEERQSFDLFKGRFEQIYSNIVNKKKNSFNMTSLEVYKKRMRKIVEDYEKYGVDPSKMANWNPVIIERNHSTKPKTEMYNEDSDKSSEGSVVISEGNNRHEYALRPSKKILISYPADFTVEEAKSIKSFADYLISIRGGEPS